MSSSQKWNLIEKGEHFILCGEIVCDFAIMESAFIKALLKELASRLRKKLETHACSQLVVDLLSLGGRKRCERILISA